ncbi:MAG TPA: XRE family transcriptional regulator [Thermoanaerobaculia bacterium]|nr:XRE family transcriptional regulator [Thermoanaerobaculia bacterium]
MGHPAEIGANVRRRRRALGLTLEQLAAASGVSPAMLSEVERSVKNPTVKLAYQVARALGCSLTDLLEDEEAEAPAVVRAADRRTLLDPETGVERHGLSPELLRRGLELVWYAIPPGRSAGEMAANRRGIVEHVTVVQGTLTLVLGGRPTRLAKGDGITYRPQTTVEYRNAGRSPCAFILLSDSTQVR